MSHVTSEMDELEKQKVKYQYLARFHELKIQYLKAQQNVVKVREELTKVEDHLKAMDEGES